MALVKGIVFVTTASAVVAGFSHPMHFRKVDANTAKSVAAFKKLNITTGDGLLANEQGFWFSHFTVGGSDDLEILIDTGSSDAIMNPGIYQPSPSSRNAGRRFNIAYATTNPDGSGTLSASGKVYYDVITQHGANLSVARQVIGDIDSPTSPPTFPHDGLIGYAGQDGASLQDNPFINSLCNTGALSACRFGLALRTNGTGTLHYGTVATNEFSGALTTVPITSAWSVTGSVTVNGKSIASRLDIATDSGTTVVFGPTSVVSKVFKAAGIKPVQTENGIQGHYSCSKPPVVGFSLGGQNFNINPNALAFESSGDDCTASLIGTNSFGSTWLLGQAFFQGRYIDHNIDDNTMGFANLK